MTLKNGCAQNLFTLKRMQFPKIISLRVSIAHLFVWLPSLSLFLMQVRSKNV